MKAFWNNLTEHKPLRLVAVFLFATIAVAVFTGITFATNVVTVIDGEKTSEYQTMNDDVTPEEILESEGIDLSRWDEIEFTGFGDGRTATLTVRRAFPVTVSADGKTQTVMITGGTFADVLDRAGVTVSEDDIVNVSLEGEVYDGASVVVHRITYETVTREVPVPFETKKEKTDAIYKGSTLVKEKGVAGVRTETYRQALLDGEVFETTYVSSEVTTEPVDEVVWVGTGNLPVASRLVPDEKIVLDENGVPVNYTKVYTGKATAYSSRRYPNVKGASGQILKPGSVAVNPKLIPYGTKLYIVSTDGKYVYGYAVAADTGTTLMQGTVLVDCFFATYEESVRFGAKKVNVYVLP